ncbi:MAG: nucleotide exchange factor GrpE [Deltaproteobacteria bacterium]|nr:nucleotide exchange factor GrpE [Candidatus Anaeroferrophillacea bacterium]
MTRNHETRQAESTAAAAETAAASAESTAAETAATATAAGDGAPESAAAGPADAAAEVERLRGEVAELRDRILLVQADAENFRKRMNREKEDVIRFAKEEFIRDILPLKDNLERALAHTSEAERCDAIYAGVKMVLDQFASVLGKMGVTPVDALNHPFNPAFHEAMLQQESGEVPPNTVICEHQKGYCYHDRLLRPALVTVARAPAGD